MKCCIVLVLSLTASSLARPDISLTGAYLPASSGSILQSPVVSGRPSGGFIQSQFDYPSISLPPTGSYLPGIGGEGRQTYFYATPDVESSRLQIQVAPSNKKLTKIVFVKAPSAPVLRPEIIAPPSVSEVRTLVYVLVKKPEETQSITIPAQIRQTHSKPEIIFIKYKTLQEAEQAIQQSLAGQSVGPGLEATNQQAFIKNLEGSLGGTNGNILGASDLLGGSGGIPGGLLQGGNTGGFLGGSQGIFSGSNLLGSVSGGNNGINGGSNLLGGAIGNGISSSKYGPAGASGPY